jgi:hypothetical protein
VKQSDWLCIEVLTEHYPRLVLAKETTTQLVSGKSEAPEQRRPLNPILCEEHPIIVLVAGPFFRIFEIVRCKPHRRLEWRVVAIAGKVVEWNIPPETGAVGERDCCHWR